MFSKIVIALPFVTGMSPPLLLVSTRLALIVAPSLSLSLTLRYSLTPLPLCYARSLAATAALAAVDGCTRSATVEAGDTCDSICEWDFAFGMLACWGWWSELSFGPLALVLGRHQLATPERLGNV